MFRNHLSSDTAELIVMLQVYQHIRRASHMPRLRIACLTDDLLSYIPLRISTKQRGLSVIQMTYNEDVRT